MARSASWHPHVATPALVALMVLAACGASSATSISANEVLLRANKHKPQSGLLTIAATTQKSGTTINVTGTGKFTDPTQAAYTFMYPFQGQTVTIDVVAITDKISIRESTNGQWLKDPAGNFDQNDPTNYEVNQPQLVGTETIRSIATYHLRGTNNEGVPIEFWFRTDTYYPVKAHFTSLTSAVFQDVTLDFHDLDSKVTIDLP